MSLLYEITSKQAYSFFISYIFLSPIFTFSLVIPSSFYLLFYWLMKCQAKFAVNICDICSPIARALSTFTSHGAIIPFMIFVRCSCSVNNGFPYLFSSSLILFLSSVSNFLLLISSSL